MGFSLNICILYYNRNILYSKKHDKGIMVNTIKNVSVFLPLSSCTK